VLGRSKSSTRQVPARTGKRLKGFTTAGNAPKNQPLVESMNLPSKCLNSFYFNFPSSFFLKNQVVHN